MRRRGLLAALAGLTARCRTTVPATGDQPATETGTSGTRGQPTTQAPDPAAVVTGTEVDDVGLRETFGAKVGISVLDAGVHPTDTARVRLALRALADTERRLTYERRNCDRTSFEPTTTASERFCCQPPSTGRDRTWAVRWSRVQIWRVGSP